ncbi:MAG: site-specific integrase [Nitrososphaerota archaeon]|jgi:integrase|nr:site-specific integrase [Nitrososphaerota archaeon]
MFRHWLAIHLLESKVPIPIISARLGHSSILATLRYYLIVTPEVQRQFVMGKL